MGVSRCEVTDTRPDVERKGAGVGEAIQGEGMGSIVGNLTADGHAGDLVADVEGGLSERGLRDVDGLIDDGALAPYDGREKDACLGRGPGTEFDKCEVGRGIVAARLGRKLDDLVCMGSEEATLGAGE